MIPATATTFFGGDRHLAGWYTPPAPGTTSRDCAVLLCQPIGHESMCSHRAFRVLACDLAALGFAVFRFDYYGTGDSAGPSSDDSLVPEWVANVSIAADELRRRCGCERIAMVGLRFGATLAAKAAEERDDVSALVLWSPTVSGKSFVRQTRMLAIAAVSTPEILTPEKDGLESIGFLLNAATVADIARLNMRDVAYSVKSILIMTRSDGPSEDDLISSITREESRCEEKRYDRHAEFMITPLHSTLPYGALTTIGQWLSEQFPQAERSAGRGAEDTRIMPAIPHAIDGVVESGVVFASGRIAGVISEPASPCDNPAVLVLNTGADHHVGPHRVYVPLARRWAAMGFPVLRFDLAGLGDSESNDQIPANDSYPLSALDDVREAIAFLRHERGYDRVILAGMCSGAFHSMHAADSSLTGIIAVNPPLFHHAGDPILPDPHYNNQTEARRVAKSLFRPTKWRRLIGGQVDVVTSLKVIVRRFRNGVIEIGAATGRLLSGEKSEGEKASELFVHGLPIHLVFDEGDKAQVFFEHDIARHLNSRGRDANVTIDIVPGADHTFMPVRWQRVLDDLMTARLLEHASADVGGTESSVPGPVAEARS